MEKRNETISGLLLKLSIQSLHLFFFIFKIKSYKTGTLKFKVDLNFVGYLKITSLLYENNTTSNIPTIKINWERMETPIPLKQLRSFMILGSKSTIDWFIKWEYSKLVWSGGM